MLTAVALNDIEEVAGCIVRLQEEFCIKAKISMQ